jgi:nucleoside-diphosphate-sugar epimerase
VLGTGSEKAPTFLEAYREKCVYQRVDFARSRDVQSFFASERVARARLDSVIHLPFAAERPGARIPGNLPSLVAETQRLLDACREVRGIERLVYLSSGFVYRPEPGNANVVNEDTGLDLETQVDAEIRAWIDADLLCQRELDGRRLRVTILRAAAIVSDGGAFVHSPPLERGEPAVGFDPMFSVVSDRDVARALVLALHGDRPGIYNVAGSEVFPRSELCAEARRVGRARSGLGAASSRRQSALGFTSAGPLYRYGLALDTATLPRRSPSWYRIEVRRRARRIDAVRCR